MHNYLYPEQAAWQYLISIDAVLYIYRGKDGASFSIFFPITWWAENA